MVLDIVISPSRGGLNVVPACVPASGHAVTQAQAALRSGSPERNVAERVAEDLAVGRPARRQRKRVAATGRRSRVATKATTRVDAGTPRRRTGWPGRRRAGAAGAQRRLHRRRCAPTALTHHHRCPAACRATRANGPGQPPCSESRTPRSTCRRDGRTRHRPRHSSAPPGTSSHKQPATPGLASEAGSCARTSTARYPLACLTCQSIGTPTR